MFWSFSHTALVTAAIQNERGALLLFFHPNYHLSTLVSDTCTIPSNLSSHVKRSFSAWFFTAWHGHVFLALRNKFPEHRFLARCAVFLLQSGTCCCNFWFLVLVETWTGSSTFSVSLVQWLCYSQIQLSSVRVWLTWNVFYTCTAYYNSPSFTRWCQGAHEISSYKGTLLS